jgi:hypothetical protein
MPSPVRLPHFLCLFHPGACLHWKVLLPCPWVISRDEREDATIPVPQLVAHSTWPPFMLHHRRQLGEASNLRWERALSGAQSTCPQDRVRGWGPSASPQHRAVIIPGFVPQLRSAQHSGLGVTFSTNGRPGNGGPLFPRISQEGARRGKCPFRRKRRRPLRRRCSSDCLGKPPTCTTTFSRSATASCLHINPGDWPGGHSTLCVGALGILGLHKGGMVILLSASPPASL